MNKLIIKLLKSLKLYYTARIVKRSIDRYAWWNIPHRKESLQFYSQFIRKGDLCFDVGANMGNRADIFRELGQR